MIAAPLLVLAAVAATPDWPAVSQAASTYQAEQSAASATRLLSLLPPRTLEPSEYPPEGVAEPLYRLLPSLARRVLAGDVVDARLAFRLLHVADGAFAEELLALLGELAGRHPEVFLQELSRARGEFSPDFDPIRSVAMLDPELADGAEVPALQSREAALRRVKEPGLLLLRDECVQVLLERMRPKERQ